MIGKGAFHNTESAMSTQRPRPDTAFSAKQFHDAYPKGIEHHFWNVARNGMVSDLLQWIERRQGASIGPMLEVGCGRGIVVDYLRRHRRDCYGVELAQVPVDRALAGHVWTGKDCFALPAAFRDRVELILLLDVIEHVENPTEFLLQIKKAYRNCRWLIVSVPARMELWSDFDEMYGHFRRYDGQSLREHFTRGGAELVRWRYRFAILYPLIYAVVRWGRGRPGGNRTPALLRLHRLLGTLIRYETWFVPSFVYGSSILAVGEFRVPSERHIG